jgi:hypothetical protein
LLAVIVLLLVPSLASANFVYWTNQSPGSSIGRAKINGTGANNAFIAGLNDPHGVAVDSKFIYWSQGDGTTGSIGRANIDGSGANSSFIPHSAGIDAPQGVAVTPTSIYWANGDGTIGRANIDGGSPTSGFITLLNSSCGLAADSSFVYYTDGGNNKVGRAPLGGGAADPYISVPMSSGVFCGIAVDPNFVYWGSDVGNSVGRAPVGGGTADATFLPAGTTGGGPTGVAVNSQYIFWGNSNATAIGRSNINGGSPNPTLIPGASNPLLLAAAPSNKITVNSVTKKKSKGTATINAKVPGPGQITLNQTSTPPDTNATAAAVKQVGLTIPQASSFSLAVKPVGKTAKKLNKQIKKQLKKKRKAKATAKVKTYIHFIPAGVAGVPNTLQVNVTLVKQAKKK